MSVCLYVSFQSNSHIFLQLTRQSIHIQKGEKGQIELTLTVPFPCVYKDAVQLNEIADHACPLHVELAIPRDPSGVCESRLVGEVKCGIQLNAKYWNVPYTMNITHQPVWKYKLSLAEAERTLYLKTYTYDLSNAWSNLLLPAVKVIILFIFKFDVTNLTLFSRKKYSNFRNRFTLRTLKVDGKEQVVQHIVIHT